MQTALPNYHLLAKPAGAACNLGCKYCFFLSKENLYPPRESPLMDEATLETYIKQLMESSPGPQVDVAWQGGEPMLRGLEFYKRSVVLAEKYRKPQGTQPTPAGKHQMRMEFKYDGGSLAKGAPCLSSWTAKKTAKAAST